MSPLMRFTSQPTVKPGRMEGGAQEGAAAAAAADECGRGSGLLLCCMFSSVGRGMAEGRGRGEERKSGATQGSDEWGPAGLQTCRTVAGKNVAVGRDFHAAQRAEATHRTYTIHDTHISNIWCCQTP